MAPPRKPTTLKVLNGTHRADRTRPGDSAKPPGAVLEATHAPPTWLPNVWAVEEWRRLAPLLTAAGLLTESSLSSFAAYCSLIGSLAEAMQTGKRVPASWISALRALAGEFALTPASAMRLPAAVPPDPKPNQFANNGHRRA